MARAYKDYLCRKIFEAHAKGHGSFRKLAAVFGVSLGYVEKIFRQRQASALSTRIAALVEVHPDVTVAELRERLALESGVAMSWSMVRLWVGQLGLRLKKSTSMPSSGTRKQTASGVQSSSTKSAPSRRRG